MKEFENELEDMDLTIASLEKQSKIYLESIVLKALSQRKNEFMSIYDGYAAQFSRAVKEKNHTINLISFLKSKRSEKSLYQPKPQVKSLSKSPQRTIKYLSSEKLRSLTKSKSPLKKKNLNK